MVEENFESKAIYVLGILSIIAAFANPMVGLVSGIIGVVLGKKQKSELAIEGKKLSKLGLILSIVVLIIFVVSAIYFGITKGLGQLGNFPTA